MPTITSTRLIVGMEVHVELATRTKMFTRIANVAHPDNYDAAPNTLIDSVVVALPGSLPVMNRCAVEMSMLVGLSLGCSIPAFSKWDRKNYYYPDLPKGYQISQYDLPLCVGGELEIPDEDGTTVTIGIIRAHLEEDTGKLSHELPGGQEYSGSLVDLNRAGTPLLEIVTAPDLQSAHQAVTFGQELRKICRTLKVTEGIMQRGHMRFEPNVNVIITTDDGVEHATPIVEMKNLNSFRAVHGAIEYEATRQVEQWAKDGIEMGPGAKATRGWDEQKNVSVLQREKEDAHDYRYFPDPDLVPVIVDEAWVEEVRSQLPELPIARSHRYQLAYGLDGKDAAALTDEIECAQFYEACILACQEEEGCPDPRASGGLCAKWILNAGAKRANEQGCAVWLLGITPEQLAGIIAMRQTNAIGSSAADTLFGNLCGVDGSALAVAEEAGLLQVTDTAALDAWIDAATVAHPQAAEDFAAGKDAAAGRLIGDVMRASGGQADAAGVRARLLERLR
jgi:aspartyl-tRNA(Asn)/glutamyl-tRNA(Gln) amidotransferase subunit B